MTHIICIGECMVEMAPTATAGNFQMGFAGDTMNTAWYLRKLLPEADQVDYFTALGTDAVSDQMVDFLDQAGVGTKRIARVPELTVGLYMIQLNEGERSFSYWRGQSAARTLSQDLERFTNALDGADIAYFSGITVAILPQEDRAKFFDALRDFRANGGRTVFDPNLRPRLWKNAEDMTATIMEAATVSDMVLPSHEDEAEWFGDTDPQATITRYRGAGVSTIIVKNGADEMLAYESGETISCTPERVQDVVDTTAAGDSFNAGFLAAHISGQSCAQAMQAGAALAARVIGARGALIEDF